MTAKETCGSMLDSVFGSRTESILKNKIILNSLATVINKNKGNAAGNSEKIVPLKRAVELNLFYCRYVTCFSVMFSVFFFLIERHVTVWRKCTIMRILLLVPIMTKLEVKLVV